MNTSPRIVFFGTPDFAVWVFDALLTRGIKPDLIITAPDAPKGRKLIMTPPAVKVWADTHGIPTLQPEEIKSAGFEETLRNHAGTGSSWDLFLVVAYGKIIPEHILNIPKRKTLNVHPSLLPLLRGSSPLQTAILNDMKDTGVTIMRLDREMDHGPVIAQETLHIPTGETWPLDVQTLGKTLALQSAELLSTALPSIIEGTITETEQDHHKATYTKKISKEDGRIDLTADGYTNFLKFKAYKGWPGVFYFTMRDGKESRVTVTDAVYENGKFIIRKIIPEGKKEVSLSSF